MQLAIQQQQKRMLSYVFKNYNDEVTVSTNGPDAQCGPNIIFHEKPTKHKNLFARLIIMDSMKII